jgi:hypothetical protein
MINYFFDVQILGSGNDVSIECRKNPRAQKTLAKGPKSPNPMSVFSQLDQTFEVM